MPDIQSSPLAQAAGGGNNLQTEAFQKLLSRSDEQQDYLTQQRQAYNAELENYSNLVKQSQESGVNDAGRWGAIASALARVPPTWGNIGTSIAAAGSAASSYDQAQMAEALKSQHDLTKLRQDEVRAMEARNQNAAMLRALSGNYGKSSNPTIKVVDGKLIAAKWDPETQSYSTEVLSGSQDQIKSRIYQNFYNKAVAAELPNPEEYAQQQTEKTLTQFGGMTVKGEANAIPGVKGSTQPSSSVEGVGPQEGIGPQEGEGTTGISPSLAGMLIPEDQAVATRLVARINANPATAKNDTLTLQRLLTKYDERSKASSVQPAPTVKSAPITSEVGSLRYPDKPKKAMETGTAEETGKALGKEHESLNAAAQASGAMVNQLDLLEKLYSTPNMPEGELAPQIQQLRSGLKSLGIDTGEGVGAADMARAVATKFALHTRTGEGGNLLPGQMSNYEDKLLQQMSPVLSLTQEGRLALTQYMRETAKSNMRVAHEANAMADANRGILPSDWRARRERIMKEEMARLTQLNRKIMSRFKGAK